MKSLREAAAKFAELEAKNAALEAEVARLKREREPAAPQPEPEPVWRELPGQAPGVLFDRNGNRKEGAGAHFGGMPSAPQQAGGGGGWGFKIAPNGRTWTDGTGVTRSAASGEIVAVGGAIPQPPGTSSGTPSPRAMDLELITRMTPIHPVGPARRPDDAAEE